MVDESGTAFTRHRAEECFEPRPVGAGFSPDDLHPHLSGWTLAGMRERSQILGGRLTVTSGPGTGTSILLEVPVRFSPPS